MIEYVHGDVLNCNVDICCHQVNCQGVMGIGLAKQVKTQFPLAYTEYKQLCNRYRPIELLGNTQFVRCGNITIANMFGQNNYGRDSCGYTDYEELDRCIYRVYRKCIEYNYSVAFPYMLGCDHSGGDWEVVENIIKKYFEKTDIVCKIVRFKND